MNDHLADPPVTAQRSRIMAAIRGKDTKPELLVRSGLHRAGLRFRKAPAGLPGRPDVVLARHRSVVFVHGCFWHGHDCPNFRWPRTRAAFWRAKIERNRQRDAKVTAALLADGWRVFTVWECRLKPRPPGMVEATVARLARLIRGRHRRQAQIG